MQSYHALGSKKKEGNQSLKLNKKEKVETVALIPNIPFEFISYTSYPSLFTVKINLPIKCYVMFLLQL